MAIASPMQIDRAEVLSHLRRHPVLQHLGEDALAGLLAYAQPRALRTRTRLFGAGDTGTALYLVLSGCIKLSRPGPAGRDVVLELAGPGSLFGELAVLCALPRAADATALGTSRVLTIDGRALIAALRANPDALLAVVRLLGERLARTTAQMEDGQMPAEPRLARALLRLAGPDQTIDLGLSQSELGEVTGLARESINKLLGAWRELGWVRQEGRRVILADVEAVRKQGLLF